MDRTVRALAKPAELLRAALLQAAAAGGSAYGEREACAVGVFEALALEGAAVARDALDVEAVRPLLGVLLGEGADTGRADARAGHSRSCTAHRESAQSALQNVWSERAVYLGNI